MKTRLRHRLITFIIITAFLCQDIAFAKGSGMLTPESKVRQIVEELHPDLREKWELFKQDPSRLAMPEMDRLRIFLQENWDSIPEVSRHIFLESLLEGILQGAGCRKPADGRFEYIRAGDRKMIEIEKDIDGLPIQIRVYDKEGDILASFDRFGNMHEEYQYDIGRQGKYLKRVAITHLVDGTKIVLVCQGDSPAMGRFEIYLDEESSPVGFVEVVKVKNEEYPHLALCNIGFYSYYFLGKRLGKTIINWLVSYAKEIFGPDSINYHCIVIVNPFIVQLHRGLLKNMEVNYYEKGWEPYDAERMLQKFGPIFILYNNNRVGYIDKSGKFFSTGTISSDWDVTYMDGRIVVKDKDGKPVENISSEFSDGLVKNIRGIANPIVLVTDTEKGILHQYQDGILVQNIYMQKPNPAPNVGEQGLTGRGLKEGEEFAPGEKDLHSISITILPLSLLGLLGVIFILTWQNNPHLVYIREILEYLRIRIGDFWKIIRHRKEGAYCEVAKDIPTVAEEGERIEGEGEKGITLSTDSKPYKTLVALLRRSKKLFSRIESGENIPQDDLGAFFNDVSAFLDDYNHLNIQEHPLCKELLENKSALETELRKKEEPPESQPKPAEPPPECAKRIWSELIPGPEREMGMFLEDKYPPEVVEDMVKEGMHYIEQGVLKGGAGAEQLVRYMAILKDNKFRGQRQKPVRLIYYEGIDYIVKDEYGNILGWIPNLVVLKKGHRQGDGLAYEHIKKGHLHEFMEIGMDEEEMLDWLVKTVREGHKESFLIEKGRKGLLGTIEFSLYREEKGHVYKAIVSSDGVIITFYVEYFQDEEGLSIILNITPEQTLRLMKYLTGRVPVSIDRTLPNPADIEDLVIGFKRDRTGVHKVRRRIYYYPGTKKRDPFIGIWDHEKCEMILMDLNRNVFDVVKTDKLKGFHRVEITNIINKLDSDYLRRNEKGEREISYRGGRIKLTSVLLWLLSISYSIPPALKTIITWTLLIIIYIGLVSLLPSGNLVGASKITVTGLGIPIAIALGLFSPKDKGENIRQLERSRDMILEKVKALNGSRPLWVRIYGDQNIGKSVLAEAIQSGIGDIKFSEIKIIDDTEIMGMLFGISIPVGCRLVVVVALGNDAFDIRSDYDVNVYMSADKETKIENTRAKLAHVYAKMTVDERERSIQSILKADEEDIDGFRDTKTKPDFTIDMSKDKRPSLDEMRKVFAGGSTLGSERTRGVVLEDALSMGIRYLKEDLGGGETLRDRIIWTGISPSGTTRTQSWDLSENREAYTLISVGQKVFEEIEWRFSIDEFRDLPFKVVKDAVNNLLLRNDGGLLSQRLSNALGRRVDLDNELEWIWIDKFQEGSEEGVFRVTVHLKNRENVKFGIISAKNPELGGRIVKNDRENLDKVRRLYQDFNREHGDVLPQEIPQVYEDGCGSCNYQGESYEIYMFMIEWLDNVYEAHPLLDNKGSLIFWGLERAEPKRYWDVNTSRLIRERSVMIAATLFELTGGKLPRVAYSSGDIVADANEKGDVESIYLITIPYFFDDKDPLIASIQGAEAVFKNICRWIRDYNLTGASLDERYLLFILNFLNISVYIFGLDEDGVPQKKPFPSKLFPEQEIVFSGITKALIRMYGEEEGIRRAVNIFEKFSLKRTGFQEQALEYLKGLKKKYGLEEKADNQSEERGLREYLQGIKPGSFIVVSLERLLRQYGLGEGKTVSILEELGFRPVSGDEDKWKREKEGGSKTLRLQQLVERIKNLYPDWEPIGLEVLENILNKDKLPSDWPSLVSAMRRDGIIDEDDFRVIMEIGRVVEKDTDLGIEVKELLTKSICINYLIQKADLDSGFKARLKGRLKSIGYISKVDLIIMFLRGLKRRLKREGGVFNNRSEHDFVRELEQILGMRGEIFAELSVENTNLRVSDIMGNKDNGLFRFWTDIFELNQKQWKMLEGVKDKQPKGVIVQDIRNLGRGVQNWLEGIRRYNVDISDVQMAYLVDGVSEEEKKALLAKKPPNVILLEEIKGENIVYLARRDRLEKYKGRGIKLVERGNAGPVIELSLCLYLLDTDDIGPFNEKLARLGFEGVAIIKNGYIKLPEIKDAKKMWEELEDGVSYLDVWA